MIRWGLIGLLLGGIMSLGFFTGEARLFAQTLRVAQSGTGVPTVDLGDRTVIEKGERLFRQNCTGYCHGKEGRRARAPQLRGRTFTSDYLYSIIANGSPPMGALPMPAFKTKMTEGQIWELVAYIHSLAAAKEN
jgi:mono/diheme cytochrome c family protein